MNKQGLTLIELLVVVLIIGILAAVALPYYQNAVVHSRFSQLQITASALRLSAQRYRMSMGKWPQDFSMLDIRIPGEISQNGTVLTSKDCECEYYETDAGEVPFVGCYTVTEPEVGYLVFYTSNDRYCLAITGDEKGEAFCETLGGEVVPSNVEGMTQYSIP